MLVPLTTDAPFAGHLDQKYLLHDPAIWPSMQPPRSALMSLVRLIAAGDTAIALQIIAARPRLARAVFSQDATRKDCNTYYLDAIGCYIYAGDSAPYVAAAAYQHMVVDALLAAAGMHENGAAPSRSMPPPPGWTPVTSSPQQVLRAGSSTSLRMSAAISPCTRHPGQRVSHDMSRSVKPRATPTRSAYRPLQSVATTFSRASSGRCLVCRALQRLGGLFPEDCAVICGEPPQVGKLVSLGNLRDTRGSGIGALQGSAHQV